MEFLTKSWAATRFRLQEPLRSLRLSQATSGEALERRDTPTHHTGGHDFESLIELGHSDKKAEQCGGSDMRRGPRCGGRRCSLEQAEERT